MPGMIAHAKRAAATALAAACAAPAARATNPPAEFPHPVITEILFDVPPADAGGDANADGARPATGDEFVELFNPHSEPINLGRYTITDRWPDGSNHQLRFTFPDITLAPGGVAVVFNGYGAAMSGPVGDENASPLRPHPDFHDALVFSMRNERSSRAFTNRADAVVLFDPSGQPVETVYWGEPNPPPPPRSPRIFEADRSPRGSVQRPGPDAGPDGDFTDHADVGGAGLFSPGLVAPPNRP